VKAIAALVQAICLSALCTACTGGSSIEVRSEEYGKEWPYPDFDKGEIRCVERSFGAVVRPLVVISLDGRDYGLNGAAFGVGGYPDARTLLKRHPEWGTYELGATHEFIQRGLDLC
jgi:hypothetical protein